ncbi:MAG: hypothetical protein V4555_04445 [Acidobacteriota bacterium]
MRPLSAIEAIGPAWNHTTRLFSVPNRWRLLLKIGFIACVAQVGGCHSSFNGSGNHMQDVAPHVLQGISPSAVAAAVAAAFAVGVALLVVWLVLLYIGSRLQFVLFEVVLRSDTTVGPIWRRYGPATWRWIGLKLLYFLVAFLCAAPVIVPFAIHLLHNLPSHDGGSPQQMIAFVMGIMGVAGVVLLALLIISSGYSLLSDFGLPSMALESTSFSETVNRVLRLIRVEPLQVFVYLVMHVLMRFVGVLCAEIVIVFATLVALIPLGGIAAGLWFLLHQGGVGGHVVMIAGWPRSCWLAT